MKLVTNCQFVELGFEAAYKELVVYGKAVHETTAAAEG